jgi:hypothetical protein
VIYGRELEMKKAGHGGGGNGPFPNFLESLMTWMDRPILTEIEAPPKYRIAYEYTLRSPFADKGRRDDQEEAMILQHLHEQMGLTFTRERRALRVLFIERAAPGRIAAE